jgi:hypothetical protein
MHSQLLLNPIHTFLFFTMAIQSSSTNKKSSKLVVSKKRSGIFDAIASLDSQDNQASKRKQRSTEKDVRQSKAAQSQVQIYQRLMEVRILLQRVMTTNEGGAETSSQTEQKQELCQQLLSQLMTARSTLTGAESKKDDDDDKEEQIESSYQDLKPEWKTVLNRRYKDLRLHSGLTAKAQFKLLDSDFYHQVETTAQYQLANAKQVAQQSNDDAVAVAFDDAKLYQHQLQDFLSLDNKKSNSTNVLDTKKSRRKQQNKKNTSVDRKASKGRKIRYHVYPKIVNFTFPLQRAAASGNTTMDSDEWFKSLFGGGTKSITQSS